MRKFEVPSPAMHVCGRIVAVLFEKVKFTESDHHGHAFFIQSTTTFLANLRRVTFTYKQQLPRTLNHSRAEQAISVSSSVH